MAEMTSAVADGRTHIHPAALLGMHNKAEINTIRRRGPNNMVAMGLNWVTKANSLALGLQTRFPFGPRVLQYLLASSRGVGVLRLAPRVPA